MIPAGVSALDGNVLMLNRYYAAIRVVSIRRALSMLYREMAEVVHVGDVIKQTERTFENINALLEGYDATLADMKMIVVYLRDSSDYPMVTAYLNEHMPPETAYIVVLGAVCRPTWLVEMDGIAVKNNGTFQFF